MLTIHKEGHRLLDLNTGKMIARRTVTQTPITQNVINLIHKAAEMDNNEVEDEENEYDEINSNE
jgi:hypothetical protein